MIIWAGTSNKDVGMVVEHYPSVILPKKKQEIQKVPGRNGDIVLSDGSFENYEQTYRVFLDSKHIGGLEQVMPKLTNWLLGHDGYQRLEDSYFPNVYRMAYYSGGSEFISIFNEYGEGNLTFNCAPEKYLKSGEQGVSLTSGQVLRNPTSFAAFPLITIYGNGALVGNFAFNGVGFTINHVPEILVIDTKQHTAYAQTAGGPVNYSPNITGRYENLKLGAITTVTWDTGILGASLIPRWWTI